MDEQIWRASWDQGLDDLDPALFETDYVHASNPAFKLFANRIALAYMGTEITFAELDRYANRFARMLIENGFRKRDVVGINLPNIPEFVIAWLGTLRAGCAVSGLSPLLSGDEMAHQLHDSGARGLVTLDAIYAARLAGIVPRLPDLKLVVAAGIGGFVPPVKRFIGKLLKKIPSGAVRPLAGITVYKMEQVIAPGRFSDDAPDIPLTPDDLAYIQYTGGTTGMPKGACLTHRNSVSDMLITLSWLNWESGRGIALSGFPFFHIAGLFFNINCIYLGWTQILVPNPRDTDYICRQIARYRPTTLVNVPSLYFLLVANPAFKTLDHSRLRDCVSAAAPYPADAQKELEAVVGQGKLLEVYGMTETSPLTVMNPSKNERKLGYIGLPILNTRLKLVDPQTGWEVAIGQPGELWVKGPQVMIGYHHNSEETAKAMDRDGYMHTGDVGIMDEKGYIRLVDRTKDMIIVSGFKVFSKKVEEILAEHPAVEMIALVGVEHPDRPGSELVKAFMTVNPGYRAELNDDDLKQDILTFARERLAPYEVPKLIEIRTELPLTVVGKIDKKKLRQMSAAS